MFMFKLSLMCYGISKGCGLLTKSEKDAVYLLLTDVLIVWSYFGFVIQNRGFVVLSKPFFLLS